ncbi:hypothetical protein ACLOJK_014753 [Asimina triloba]
MAENLFDAFVRRFHQYTEVAEQERMIGIISLPEEPLYDYVLSWVNLRLTCIPIKEERALTWQCINTMKSHFPQLTATSRQFVLLLQLLDADRAQAMESAASCNTI